MHLFLKSLEFFQKIYISLKSDKYMKKTTKLLIASAFILLAIAALIYLVFPEMTSFVTFENSSQNVKIGTFAVCENQGNYTYCKDKIFASCNGVLMEINDPIFYCEGKKYNASNITLGETYHTGDWNDPRSKDLLTAWASSS